MIKLQSSLPAAVDLLDLYRRWQMLYSHFYQYQSYRRGQASSIDPDFELDTEDTTRFSELEFEQMCQRLPDRFNQWLDCEQFRAVERKLHTYLHAGDEIHFTIETEDEPVQRLPWSEWRFFAAYPHSEVELSALDSQRTFSQGSGTPGVKILVILGDSTGINVAEDRKTIAAIPGARPEFLVEPKATELSDRLWAKGWDILFFAGHSSSQNDTGRIYLNATESLTIAELRPALRTAIAKGLKLAIFNSCDGLKLARDLADLHIPATIVMREPVPDRVAQAFLKYFLPAFARGESLHQAFRQAREQLHIWQREFPCASWLPTLVRNPAEEPPSWEGLLHKDQPLSRSPWLKLGCLLLCSVVVTGLVIQVRRSGALQTLEQQAYDHTARFQVTTPVPDDRLLVVRVDPKELTPAQRSEDGRLNDQTLAELVKTLRQYQPELIGLDIYRDQPVGKGTNELYQQLQQSPQLISICKSSEDELTREGYIPNKAVPKKNIGFSDLIPDSDGIVRRHLIQMKPEEASPCQSELAFSTVLSLRYLERIKVIPIIPEEQSRLQLDSTIFQKLQAPVGVYQKADTGGYQALLRYRPYHNLKHITPSVTLLQVLGANKINLEKIKGKVVLIGYDDDLHATPYSLEGFPERKTPGVFIHAQMTSQVISAVLDGRALLQFLPAWADNLWIWSWALIGGILVWQWQSSRSRLIAIGSSSGVLCLICWGCLIQGFWIPLVPPALTLLSTSGLMFLSLKFQRVT
jgi:CHASE2 domain-containing sensor protein